MYMHPDGIARRMRWTGNDGGNPNWELVLDAVASECQLDRAQLAQGLRSMGPHLPVASERSRRAMAGA